MMLTEDRGIIPTELREKHIIFYDGVCGLCNRFVTLLLAIDKQKLFYFSSLQGDTAKKLLDQRYTLKPMTVVYHSNLVVSEKSDAVIKIFYDLGFPYYILTIFKLVPRFIRDFFYDLVAKYRHLLFRRVVSCDVIANRERFLK